MCNFGTCTRELKDCCKQVHYNFKFFVLTHYTMYVLRHNWSPGTVPDLIMSYHSPLPQSSLARPILYSNWLSKDYIPVDQEELREYVQARLKVFYEEELDVPLVLFNEVLDHVLRIDRIFKQNQVHIVVVSLEQAPPV